MLSFLRPGSRDGRSDGRVSAAMSSALTPRGLVRAAAVLTVSLLPLCWTSNYCVVSS